MLLDDERDEVSSPHYLREFFQTARCETVPGEKMTKDLRDTREQIEKHVTPEVWKDIENYNEDIRGTNRALQTMIHYRTWHHQLLFSALDLKGQAYHYLFHKAEKLLASLGLIVLGYGGIKGASKTYKRLFENQTKVATVNANKFKQSKTTT